MNVTVPHRQKGSALSSLRFAQGQALSEAKDLSAERDRPFASLRVTRWDGCNCERLFFTTEPCLNKLTRVSQKRRRSPGRGRLIAPTADLSAHGVCQSILLKFINSLCIP